MTATDADMPDPPAKDLIQFTIVEGNVVGSLVNLDNFYSIISYRKIYVRNFILQKNCFRSNYSLLQRPEFKTRSGLVKNRCQGSKAPHASVQVFNTKDL